MRKKKARVIWNSQGLLPLSQEEELPMLYVASGSRAGPRWSGQCLPSIHFLLGCCQHPDFPVGSIPLLFLAPGALSAQSGQEFRHLNNVSVTCCHKSQSLLRGRLVSKRHRKKVHSPEMRQQEGSAGPRSRERSCALLPRLRKVGPAETLHGLFKAEIGAVSVHGLPREHLSRSQYPRSMLASI